MCVCIGNVSAIESVRVAGWSRMIPIIQDAANDYSQLHPDVSFVVTETDSSSALRLLSEGSVDIALSPDIDTSSGLDISAFKKIPIGKTAYVIIVNSNNPISTLSTQDIRDIFHDKKTNWKQFGGTSGAILTIGLKGSITGDSPVAGQEYFRLFLEDGESRLPVKAELNSNLDILRVISNEPGAIGYTEYKNIDPDFSFNPKSRIKPVSIRIGSSTVSPSLDTIQSGSYPLVENLNVYTKIGPDQPEQDFIDFLLSNEGQSYVKSNRQCPVVPGVTVIRKISSPQTILAPGYYFLDRDLSNSEIIRLNDYNESAFIQIKSNSVTFDGMGHTIDCFEAEKKLEEKGYTGVNGPDKTISPQQNGYLMKVSGIASGYQGPDIAFTNLKIRNITIKNCKNGINVVFYQNPVIETVTLINNWKGIYFFTSTNTSVSNCTFIGNTENIGSTNSDKTPVNGNITGSTGVKEYQMVGTPYNMQTPLPALNMGFIFFLIFLPKLIPKLFEGAFDYINERFFAPGEGKEQERENKYFRILHNWIGVSVIGAMVLGGGFYYASSPSQFEIFTFGMYTLVSIVVLVSHETMHYFTAKKLGIDVKYRLWVWGIVVILTSAFLKNVVGQPVFTKLDEEKADLKQQALVMLSRPLTTILLSIPFVILWLQNEANSEYAFLLLEISVVTSLIAFLPISPLDGEKVVKWNKWVWLAIFLPLSVGFLVLKWMF